jgi:polyhydroxyalkanoate synthesis regulator phasin
MGIKEDLAKAKSLIENDLARANELKQLDSQIADLRDQVTNLQNQLSKKEKELAKDADEKLRAMFKQIFSEVPELKIEENADEIKAYTENLIYAIKFEKLGGAVSKKIGNDEHIYKFCYRRNGHFRPLSYAGQSYIGLKRNEISALEKQIEQYSTALETLEKDGLRIEYARQILPALPIRSRPITYNQEDPSDRLEYSKIDIDSLLKVIFHLN